jgi:hypothetical protein
MNSQDITKESIAAFRAAKKKHSEAEDRMARRFIGFRSRLETGHFREAKEFLRPMPECASKVLFFREIIIAECTGLCDHNGTVPNA